MIFQSSPLLAAGPQYSSLEKVGVHGFIAMGASLGVGAGRMRWAAMSRRRRKSGGGRKHIEMSLGRAAAVHTYGRWKREEWVGLFICMSCYPLPVGTKPAVTYNLAPSRPQPVVLYISGTSRTPAHWDKRSFGPPNVSGTWADMHIAVLISSPKPCLFDSVE